MGVIASGSFQEKPIVTTTNTLTVVSTQTEVSLATQPVIVYVTNTSQIQSLQSILSLQDKLNVSIGLSIQFPNNTRSYDVMNPLYYGSSAGYPIAAPAFAGYLQIIFHSSEQIHWQLSPATLAFNSPWPTEISPANQTEGTVLFPISPKITFMTTTSGETLTSFAFPPYALSIINDNCNPITCGNSFQVNATIDYYY